jgi:hypothetical protein
MVLMASTVQSALRVLLEPQVQWVLLVLQEQMELMEPQVQRVLQVPLAQQVLQEQMELMEPQVQRVLQVPLA